MKRPNMTMTIGGLMLVGALTNAEVASSPAPAGQTVILNEGSYWRYHLTARKPVYRKDQKLGEMGYGWSGSALPPAQWAAPEFDDQLWISSQGPFFPTGHGWAWIKEVDGKGYTYYEGTSESMALLCLRGKFQVTDPQSVGDLTLSLTYRGGVVVYLNGKEVARGYLPDPEKKGLEALAEDYPPEAYGDKDGKPIGIGMAIQKDDNAARLEKRLRKLTDIKIPAGSLQKGVNTLAIEVHRAPYNEVIFKTLAAHNVQIYDWVPMGLVAVNLRASGAGAVPNTTRPKGLQAWGQSIASGIGSSQYCNPLEKTQPVRIYGARNGVFAGEVVVSSSEAIKDLKVECSTLTGPSAIPVENISVRYGASEQGGWSGGYDVLDPVPPALVGVDGGTGGAVQPAILTVRLPKDVKAGVYKGKVTVTAAGASPVELPLELRVADWVMPDAKNFQMNMGLYESPESVGMQYKVPMWSEEHWKLLDKVFGYMAELGADDVYIPVRAKTHLGNSQGMVRWIPKEGSGADTYSLDFSLAEKYLDLAIKHLGKPSNVCLLLWDIDDGGGWGNSTWPAKRGFSFTQYDPKTGNAELKEGPKYGTPELREFLKPVAEGLQKIVKDRGLEKSLMLGIIGDNRATGEVYADLDSLFPGLKWVYAGHDIFRGNTVCYETYVYHVLVPSEPWEGSRKYGWKAERRLSCNRREALSVGHPGLTYRSVVESRLMCGYMGISRLGIDFWPVLGRLGSLGAGTLGRRYPDVDWSQLNFGVAAGSIISAGKDGPLGTLRFENLRVGVEESEARIVIEKALTDPALKAKLGDALATRSQEFLDDRQRQTARFLLSGYYFNGMEWEKNTGDLYQLAGEVAAALAK